MINSFYFPHGTLTQIVDINNKDLLVSLDTVVDQEHIISLCSNPIKENNKFYFEHDKLFINKISKLIDNGENDNTKFYKLTYGLDDTCPQQTMIIPEFVRLFTKINKVFLSPQLLRKTDVLSDYQERSIKIYKIELCDKPNNDFVYKLFLSNSAEKWLNFYYNGILAAI